MSGTSEEDRPDDLPSDPPPGGPTSVHPGSVKESAKERMRSRLESVIPEILKRAVEIGVEKARESPADVKQFIHDLKVPKEVAHYLFQQIDDTKNGLFRVVAKEKLLTTVQFEVNTTIRFTPNDGREPKKNNDGSAPEGADDGDAKDPKDAKDASEGDDEERTPPSRRPLPRPEVKTSVNVRRDGRDRA
jgi:hypothetical protein